MPANQEMNIWSLFSGIGGLEKGLEDAGLGEVTLQCEIDSFAKHILNKHWPHTVKMTDVKNIRLGADVEDGIGFPDLICGGFPCQPHSLAGRRKGAEDERHLWPEFARIIKEFRPTFVVAENVPGIRTNGALNEVLNDLTILGYDAEWVRLGAAAVGAPHLRERIFIVAYPGCERRQQIAESASGDENTDGRRKESDNVSVSNGESDSGRIDSRSAASDSDTNGVGRPNVKKSDSRKKARKGSELWNHAYGLCQGLAESEPFIFTDEARERLPIDPNETGWKCEPDVGRVAYGVPKRVDRLRGLGNAVVPQVAEFVGSCIYDAITREV